MITFKLPTVDEKAEYVHRQFERIARRYDITNDAISMGMHRLWKARAVDELNLKAGGRYLDVCCGTGDLALTIATRMNERGSVVGVDFSQSMLDIANQRAYRAAKANKISCDMDFRHGDAQDLPLASNTFDGAIISFGLRNLTDLEEGLRQMKRVVRPGGNVINLDLGDATMPGFAQAFNLYFRHVVPIIGQVMQSDRQAYTYLPESRTTYPKPAVLKAMFERVGLIGVRHIELSLGAVALHVGTVV